MPEMDPSWFNTNVDFNTDFNKAALQGVERQKAVGGLGALNHVDLSDPNSVGNAINNSIKSGNLEQAGALANLNWQQSIRQTLPGTLNLMTNMMGSQQTPQGQTQQQPSQVTQSNPQAAHAAETMNLAISTLNDLKSLPSEDRSAALEKARPALEARGVPTEAITAASSYINDVPDKATQDQRIDELISHYQPHADNFNTIGTGGTLSENAYQPHSTTSSWFNNFVTDPRFPQLEAQLGMLKGVGLDMTPLSETAKSLAMPHIQQMEEVAASGPKEAGKRGAALPYDLATEFAKKHFEASVEPINLYPPGSTQPQTVSKEQWSSHPDVYRGWSTEPEVGAKSYAEHKGGAQGEIEGNLGHPATAMDLENAKAQSSNLTKEATDAGNRITSNQYDTGALTARRIINTANSINTGAWTPELAKVAQQIAPALPESHLAKYATDSQLLNQDLAASAKQEFAGMGLPRIANEFKTITDQIPKNASQQDTLKLYGAIKLAKNEMSKDVDHSVMQYDQNSKGSGRNIVAARTAFDNQRPGLLAYALPELRNMTINGQPAVKEYVSADGKKLIGVFMPDPKTGKGQNFYIGPGPKQ